MHTQIASKVTAFTVALMMNALMIAGVAHLFDSQSQSHQRVVASAAAALHSTRAAI